MLLTLTLMPANGPVIAEAKPLAIVPADGDFLWDGNSFVLLRWGTNLVLDTLDANGMHVIQNVKLPLAYQRPGMLLVCDGGCPIVAVGPNDYIVIYAIYGQTWAARFSVLLN